jgi:hypothetical protein
LALSGFIAAGAAGFAGDAFVCAGCAATAGRVGATAGANSPAAFGVAGAELIGVSAAIAGAVSAGAI